MLLLEMTSDASYWREPVKWLDQAWANVEDFAAGAKRAVADFLDEPISSLQAALLDIESWLSGLPVTAWILFGLGFALMFWSRQSLRGWTRLGPIRVETIEHDAEGTAAVHALTAALRERLARSGISPPPAVPAGIPQADLIGAVEASPIPQADWVAALLKLIPRPRRPAEYELASVLTGAEGPRVAGAADTSDGSGPCGVSFWVRPSGDGMPLVDSVDGYKTHARALEVAASRIHVHIAKHAVHAVPKWARWHSEAALEDYIDGCLCRKRLRTDTAADRFRSARDEQPSNTLAHLQLGNLYEHAGPGDPTMQARALRAYLEVAENWPELVEARYRAAIVAATLASSLSEAMSGDAVLTYLGAQGESADALAKQLRGLAARESKAVRQLLRPWYVLIRERRLRTQFEPNARERRELRRTVSISKHCVRLRTLRSSTSVLADTQVAYRSLVLRIAHLWVAPGRTSWKTRYNVACFDALLYDRVGTDRVKERALRGLRQAIKDAGGELSLEWARRDPDLVALRGDAAYAKLVDPSGALPQEQPLTSSPPGAEERGVLPVPPRPWGSPGLRLRRWSLFGVLLLVPGVVLCFENLEGAGILLLTAGAFALWRARYAAWEWRLTRGGPLFDLIFPGSTPLSD